MINQPQAISLSEAVANLGAGLERLAAAAEPGSAATAMPVAIAVRDAIALSAATAGADAPRSLADAAATFGTQPGAVLPGVERAQILVAGLLRDVASTPGGSVLADPAVARGVAAGVAAALTSANAASPPGPLTSLLALVRAAVAASDPAVIGELTTQIRSTLVNDAGAIAAAVTVPAAPTAAPSALGAIVVPLFDPGARLNADAAPFTAAAKHGAMHGSEAGSALVPVPERDPYGRRYSDAARRRLEQLGCDPRRGFAPEAETALAAEERWGVRFARALDGAHDFVDADRRSWNAIAPRTAEHLDATLLALTGEAGLLVSYAAAALDALPAIDVAVRRCSASAAHPILTVDGDAEERWPGS